MKKLDIIIYYTIVLIRYMESNILFFMSYYNQNIFR